jgi:hypothetical protein
MVSPWFQIIRTHLHSFSSEFSRCKDEFSDKLLDQFSQIAADLKK